MTSIIAKVVEPVTGQKTVTFSISICGLTSPPECQDVGNFISLTCTVVAGVNNGEFCEANTGGFGIAVSEFSSIAVHVDPSNGQVKGASAVVLFNIP